MSCDVYFHVQIVPMLYILLGSFHSQKVLPLEFAHSKNSNMMGKKTSTECFKGNISFYSLLLILSNLKLLTAINFIQARQKHR